MNTSSDTRNKCSVRVWVLEEITDRQLSQRRVAKLSGLPRRTVDRFLGGQSRIALDRAEAIVEGLGGRIVVVQPGAMGVKNI